MADTEAAGSDAVSAEAQPGAIPVPTIPEKGKHKPHLISFLHCLSRSDRQCLLLLCTAAVKIHFTPVSNAPILKQTKFRVPGTWTVYDLTASLRKQLSLPTSVPLVSSNVV